MSVNWCLSDGIILSNNEAILFFLVRVISGSLGGNQNHLPTAAEITGAIHLEPSEIKRLDTLLQGSRLGVETVLKGY